MPKSTPGSKRKDDKDFIREFRDSGYTVVSTKAELREALTKKTGRLLGLFHTGNMDGHLDRAILKKNTVCPVSPISLI